MDENKGTAPADDAFKVALHAKLVAVAQRPLDARMLLELEQTARLARQFLMVSSDTSALKRMRFGTEFSADDVGVAGEIVNQQSMTVPPMFDPVVGAQQNTFSSAPKSETFGVTVIRELIASLAEFNKPKAADPPPNRLSAGDLAYGITIAKESGEPDVEAKLRKRLVRLLGEMVDEEESPRMIDAPVESTEQGAAA